MKTAWRNYRSLEEIKENLAIALKATIEGTSLSELRISFLKTQLDRASRNLENSEIDFPTLLLNAGEMASSLRNVWDGDFVLTFYIFEYSSNFGLELLSVDSTSSNLVLKSSSFVPAGSHLSIVKY